MSVSILVGDCRLRMRELEDSSVHAVVCDPPYHLTSIVKRFGGAKAENETFAATNKTNAYKSLSRGFMGQTWDGGDIAQDPAMWAEVLRVLKPGGHLVAFSGTRTYHRMAVAIEDAGFEIRDQLAWVYGSGFPKSLDVSKAIDKAAGAEREVVGINPNSRPNMVRVEAKVLSPRVDAPLTAPSTEAAQQWQGWGTSLKPAWECICLARRPLGESTVAANVLKHGVGGLNIDATRIGGEPSPSAKMREDVRSGKAKAPGRPGEYRATLEDRTTPERFMEARAGEQLGRWPANLCHDGSDEVLAGFPDSDGASGAVGPQFGPKASINAYGDWGPRQEMLPRGDSGSAARFFYTAKATSAERGEGNNHPTVKPIALMRWLCRLVTPPGGTILDPFMGSGSTLIAADAEQFNAIGCELSPEYAAIAERRIRDAAGMFADVKVAA